MNLLLLSALAGLLGHLGGIGADRPWWLRNAPKWLCDTKARDIGIPLCMMIYMTITSHYSHWLWLCFGLMFGAQTSYFKKKGTDAKWYNWLFVGLAYSLALLPYSLSVGNLPGFFLRGLVVTLGTLGVSELSGKAWVEEGTRGAIQIVTLPLLFI